MRRNLLLAIICIVLIVIITLLSATGIGFSVSESLVSSIPKTQVIKVVEDGRPHGEPTGIVVYSVTYTNTFLPRQRQLPFVTACLYNSDTKRGVYLGTRWQLSVLNNQGFSDGSNVVQLGIETKIVNLEVQPFVNWVPPERYERSVPVKPVPAFDESYDAILLFIEDEGRSRNYFPQCEFLQPEDIARAKKVQLT